MNKVFFLDRDGVINKNAAEHDYVKTVDELELLDGIGVAIARIKNAGYKVIVISNQQGVGKGVMKAVDVDEIHAEINTRLKANYVQIDAFYWCGHLINDKCVCRKPKPGLFEQAILEHEVDRNNSFFIGDRESDKIAGELVGIKTILVESDSSIVQTVEELLGYEKEE